MSNLGSAATLPLDLGGDDSSVEKMQKFLRSALGEGGSAASDTGLDGLRIAAMALGLAAASAFDERAALQAFPNLAQDAIESYEDTLGIIPTVDETDHERRQENARRWTRVLSAEVPTLNEELREIDGRYSVVNGSFAESADAVGGRAFEPYVPAGDAFLLGPIGAQAWSDYPNYNDRDLLVSLLDIGSGAAPGPTELAALRRGQELVDDVLPAWNQGFVITELGFITNQSLTGYAGVDG